MFALQFRLRLTIPRQAAAVSGVEGTAEKKLPKSEKGLAFSARDILGPRVQCLGFGSCNKGGLRGSPCHFRPHAQGFVLQGRPLEFSIYDNTDEDE